MVLSCLCGELAVMGIPEGHGGAALWPESTNSSNPQCWLLPLPPMPSLENPSSRFSALGRAQAFGADEGSVC